MTTIATDGVTIASDSQRVVGSERVDLCTKKIIVRDNRIFAFTGVLNVFAPAIEWFEAGRAPEKAPKTDAHDSWCLIVIDGDGLRTYGNGNLYGESYSYPQAFGSGQQYALAAMKAGATPAEAVEIAKDLDVFSGGAVRVVEIESALSASRVEEAAE
jgi:hypothetical protein